MSALLHMAVLSSLGSAAAGGVAAPTLTGSPTLVGSWDFDNASTITLSGGDIDQITGADGTSYTMATPANMPNQTTRSGKSVAYFDSASSEYMSVGSAMGMGSATATTIVIVFEPDGVAQTGSIVGFGKLSSPQTSNRHELSISSTLGLQGRRESATTNEGAQTATGIRCLVLRNPGGTDVASLHIDGDSTPLQTSSILSDLSTPDATYLGCSIYGSAAAAFVKGWVYRVLIYSADIGATAAEEVAAWAATNYGTANTA